MRTLLLLTLFATGCEAVGNPFEPPRQSVDCEDASPDDMVLTATAGIGDQPRGADLHVSGTALHERGLTLRSLTLDGFAVTADALNYATWSVVIPASALTPPSDGSPLFLTLTGTDACDQRVSVDVGVTLYSDVQRLGLSLALPSGGDYLPADGTTPAVLTVTANPEASGADVALGSSPGILFNGIAAQSVTLAGKAGADATANVLLTASQPGSLVLTATARDQASQLAIKVAGPPTFVPAQATLQAGQSLTVTVATDGVVDTCQATPSTGIVVTSAADDLSAVPGGTDTNGDGLVDFVVTAAETLTEPASVTVSCRDPFGQNASATFEASP